MAAQTTETDREERLRRARALADELLAESKGETSTLFAAPRPVAPPADVSMADGESGAAGASLLHPAAPRDSAPPFDPQTAKTQVYDKAALIAQSLKSHRDELPSAAQIAPPDDRKSPTRESTAEKYDESKREHKKDAKKAAAETQPALEKKEKPVRTRGKFRFFLFLLRVVCVLVVLYALAAVADRFTSFDLMGAAKDAFSSAKESVMLMLGMDVTDVTDYQDAVLGEARKQQQYIIYEKDVSVESELSQSLLDLDVFRKTKQVHSFATGYYTVDLAAVSAENVTYDPETKTVSVTVPLPALYIVDFDITKSQFEETEKGLLAFGNIELTAEEQNAFETSVLEVLTQTLSTEECFAEAQDAALEGLTSLLGPVVRAVSDKAAVRVYFAQ